MPDFAFEPAHVGRRDTEVLLREIARHRDDLFLVGAPEFRQLGELVDGALAHEQVDGLAALDQVRNEKATDEPGPAGDEIRHGFPPNDGRGRRLVVGTVLRLRDAAGRADYTAATRGAFSMIRLARHAYNEHRRATSADVRRGAMLKKAKADAGMKPMEQAKELSQSVFNSSHQIW